MVIVGDCRRNYEVILVALSWGIIWCIGKKMSQKNYINVCKTVELFQQSPVLDIVSLLRNHMKWWGWLADFPAMFFHISHWYLSWNWTSTDKSKAHSVGLGNQQSVATPVFCSNLLALITCRLGWSCQKGWDVWKLVAAYQKYSTEARKPISRDLVPLQSRLS